MFASHGSRLPSVEGRGCFPSASLGVPSAAVAVYGRDIVEELRAAAGPGRVLSFKIFHEQERPNAISSATPYALQKKTQRGGVGF